ncbi:hypothetical protein ACFSKU_02335 [Pontibacter silvestris]|uniref:Uncharacterized protein n=1 Tax=Pontibacter silvestris TaxID=2305183 RepID=A0ABW4WUS4_9BACT|nr:hypothetical protein [Pontibacter silvestris]MCC9137767.1 hypothetical protein [Pontibacter silvestris]
MRNQLKTLLWFMVLVSLGLSSCATSRDQEVEDELSDFRAWVSSQTTNVANRSKEDWQQVKQDFKQRTEVLDEQQEHFTNELKQDYQQLKNEFRSLDDSYERSRSEAKIAAWERNLLGQYADFSTINRQNVRDVYVTFIENVRKQNETWSNEDWDMAKRVLQKLNDRKSVIGQDLPTDDEVKIKALQIEFSALETADDASGYL